MTAGIKRHREKETNLSRGLQFEMEDPDTKRQEEKRGRRGKREKRKKDNQAMTARGEEKRIRESKARKMRNGWMDSVHGKVKVQG